MCFWAIFHYRSSQAGIIKLEWRVEAILWTNPEVRDNFIATGTSKVFVSSHGGSRVKLSLWPFCGWILGPTKAIWERFDLQRKQWARYFAITTGWLDAYKKTTKLGWRDFYFAEVSRLPRMQLGQNDWQNATHHLSGYISELIFQKVAIEISALVIFS